MQQYSSKKTNETFTRLGHNKLIHLVQLLLQIALIGSTAFVKKSNIVRDTCINNKICILNMFCITNLQITCKIQITWFMIKECKMLPVTLMIIKDCWQVIYKNTMSYTILSGQTCYYMSCVAKTASFPCELT